MTRGALACAVARTAMVGALLATAAAGCGGNNPGTSDGGNDAQLFVAAAASFDNYNGWKSWAFDSPGTADGLTHVSGHRVVYLNKLPPKGSSAFPVGTIIVKQIHPGESTEQIFAMVKRGGEYNTGGAKGWEWFELTAGQPDSAQVIRWRGVAPPAGENYSGSPTGTCNDCHGADSANDSVLATQLTLSGL